MSFTYVMSDIHGAYEQYEQMKKKINLQKSDILYIIGDIFDRGPGTYKILKDIMENNNIILLLGNHEFSYVQIYENNNLYKETKKEKYKQVANEWIEYISDPAAGGVVTIDFLFHKIRKEQREKYLDFLASCDTEKLLNVNGRYFYLTHGSLSTYDYLRVTERINMNLLYLLLFNENEKLESIAAVDLNKVADFHALKKEMAAMASEGWNTDVTIITGHTPVKYYLPSQKDMKIITSGNNINIDCGCTGYNFDTPDADGYIKHLACLRLDDLQEFYI